MKPSTWILLAVAAASAALATRKALAPDTERTSRDLSARCDDLSRELQRRLEGQRGSEARLAA
ncbi:hypothetical protein EON79_21600 [bacterium]|nr:MAG: hypothetical protein EON79_21600 [bacterium]